MKTAFACWSLLLCSAGFSQNLVINPGFEDISATVSDATDCFSANGVNGWYNPAIGSTDYFRIDPGNPYSVIATASYGGICKPYEGQSFAGFIAYYQPEEYREYVAGELSARLEQGKTYEISFALAAGKACSFNVDALDISFMNEKAEKIPSHSPLPVNDYLVADSLSGKITAGTWALVHKTFLAKGDEKYFVIGNFERDGNTRLVSAGAGSFGFSWAYYYIDDVSVIPVEPVSAVTIARPATASNDSLFPGNEKRVTLRTVNFDFDESIIRTESFPVLDHYVTELLLDPGMKIEIDGFTDETGAAAHNQQLSEARARSVADYFIKRGIAPGRIRTKGFGDSMPVSDDDRLNRRVELVFYQ